MAVAFVLDFPTLTVENANALMQVIAPSGKPPEGQILHFDGPHGSGIRVVDVWESEAAYQKFAETVLGPAMGQLDIQLDAPPMPQFFPVNNMLK
jgi:hypothetical protein